MKMKHAREGCNPKLVNFSYQDKDHRECSTYWRKYQLGQWKIPCFIRQGKHQASTSIATKIHQIKFEEAKKNTSGIGDFIHYIKNSNK